MFKAEDIDPIGVQCGNFAIKVIDTADFAKRMSGSACMKIVLGNEIFPTEKSERGSSHSPLTGSCAQKSSSRTLPARKISFDQKPHSAAVAAALQGFFSRFGDLL